jgi:hypothetical protein
VTSEAHVEHFQKLVPLEALVTVKKGPVPTLLLFLVRSSLRSSGAAFRLLESDICVFPGIITIFDRRCVKVLKREVWCLGILLSEDDG